MCGLGDKATILSEIAIDDSAVVSVNAVVTKDVPLIILIV